MNTQDAQRFGLPVAEIIDTTRRHLSEGNTLIVTAPAGAGKSTLLPLTWLDQPEFAGGRILMLEPRRLAARTIAMRMADMLGEDVGRTVGYRIRFETRVSPSTRIEILTEGILTRMLQSDNSLEGVAAVVFDEFHERSLHADLAMALCRECQQVLRPDLRIIVMSATLDVSGLSQLLGAPVVESRGRQYPVSVIHTDNCDPFSIAQQTAGTVIRAWREQQGDILAFLPGEAEISRCEEALRRALPDAAIHPLYGMLPHHRQCAAIVPDRAGRRKVVLATSIAETSLTIEGITTVVDCGFGRLQRFDPDTGLSRLETVPVSLDMADQRAGRAGRLRPGVCYRMWTLATESRMVQHRKPEIEYADLAPLVLDLALWGETDALRLTWLTPPPKPQLAQASELLRQLDAIADDGRITPHGRALAALPCHPRIAQMLVSAGPLGLLPLATDVAALLDERDPLPREAGIDINLRIDALRSNRAHAKGNRALDRIEKTASQYRSIVRCQADNEPFDSYDTGMLLVQAYPERIASARPGNNAQFQLSNGCMAMASHTDTLAHEPWLAVAGINAREGMGRIFMASPLNPKDLRPMVRTRDNVSWSARRGGLTAQQELRIGSIVLQAKPIHNLPPMVVAEAVCAAVEREGASLLNFSPAVEQWQNRVLSLRAWHGTDWPDVSTPALVATCRQWLMPYVDDIRTPEALRKLDILEPLLYHLTFDQRRLLDHLAPTHVQVPSGSRIVLAYRPTGEPPILAVRLQEVFGLAQTPTVDEGRHSVLMHLLSPGFKPVQITSDLRSFWDNAYFEVKKELKARYPKHVWPDKPWEEPATRGPKRRRP